MSRPLRLEFPGAFYHLTSRGDRRGQIFLNAGDREEFLRILERVVDLYRWRVHAWCQMSNHYHLLAETPEPNLCDGMRVLNGFYARHFNRTHRRVGHVFQGRYTALFVERDSYFLELARYVVLNPVRAHMVRTPQDWPWSSFRDTAAYRKAPHWLTTDMTLGLFGSRRREAVTGYRAFVAAGRNQPSPWDGLRNQVFLGSERFVTDLLEKLDARLPLNDIPSAQLRPPPLALDDYARVHPERNSAIAAAYRSGAYTLQQIATHFGLHQSRISRIVSLRDDAKAKGKT